LASSLREFSLLKRTFSTEAPRQLIITPSKKTERLYRALLARVCHPIFAFSSRNIRGTSAKRTEVIRSRRGEIIRVLLRDKARLSRLQNRSN
jgi:hypothetical protein